MHDPNEIMFINVAVEIIGGSKFSACKQIHVWLWIWGNIK